MNISDKKFKSVPPKDEWKESEKWVWEKICRGEVADFNIKNKKAIDPKKVEAWTADRIISSQFLEAILLHKPFFDLIHRRGIRIVGAWVKGDLDLTNGNLNTEWVIYNSRFDDQLNLSRIQTNSIISFHNSSFAKHFSLYYAKIEVMLDLGGVKFSEKLDMRGLSGGGSLFMGGSQFMEIDMGNSKVGGELNLNGSQVSGKLGMNAISVGGNLFMSRGAQFEEVDMTSAKVEGHLNLNGSQVSGKLGMNTISVGGNLLMARGAQFEEVDMTIAKIGEIFSLNGSKVLGKLSMNGMSVSGGLFMGKSQFMEVDMANSKVERQLFLNGCKVSGKLGMNGISVGSSLLMSGGAQFEEVDMTGAKVGGQLNLSGSRFSGKLGMNGISINNNLLMSSGAEFNEVDIGTAKVEGQLNLSGSKFSGKLDMNTISVGGSVFMGGGTQFIEVIMTAAKVGGELNLSGSQVSGKVGMNFILVNGIIKIENGVFSKNIELGFATINGNASILATKLSNIDFGSSTIRGELYLGHKIDWAKDSILNLRNAQVGTLQDAGEDSWPSLISFNGFTCSRLGGSWDNRTDRNMPDRQAKWFIDWLAKDDSYSPQPYQHLATVLTDMGHSEKSNAVLYAAKSRERKEAFKDKIYSKWLGLSILSWTIGYGIGAKYFRSLLWVLLFTTIGVLVLNTLTTMRFESIAYKIGFSFDMLLPIIELNDKYKLNFKGWQLYYFYIHKLAGFLLGSFVVAGLSGITKK